MCWVIGQPYFSRTYLTVLPWLNGEGRLLTPKLMDSTPQLKWAVVISQEKGLVRLVISGIFKLLMDPTVYDLLKTLALSLSNPAATMSNMETMVSGGATCTMVVLVEIPIAHDQIEKSRASINSSLPHISLKAPMCPCLINSLLYISFILSLAW